MGRSRSPARDLPPAGAGLRKRGRPHARGVVAQRGPTARSSATEPQSDLQIAELGIARAQRLWRNPHLGWYDSVLDDNERYPLATIWDATPLFEALDAIDIASPTPAHRAAVMAFARGAERYWDATLKPVPGFAPYPGDRGQVVTWFDDNGWWGLAFLDAYRATHIKSYIREAERAFTFIADAGWNGSGGGLWWNTSHPYIAGEPLAAGSLLGAQLFKLTGKQLFRRQVLKFLDWAESDFLTERRLYKRTESDPTPTPYIEGTLVEAHQVLCETGDLRSLRTRRPARERFRRTLLRPPDHGPTVRHDLPALDACVRRAVRRRTLAGTGRRDGDRRTGARSGRAGPVSARVGWHADHRAPSAAEHAADRRRHARAVCVAGGGGILARAGREA